MTEKSTTLQLLDLREKANKKEIGLEELIAKHYEVVKQLADAGREDEAFQLYNTTMQLEASNMNRRTVDIMSGVAQHFRDTETVFGNDVDDFQKGVQGMDRSIEGLQATGNRFANVSEEMARNAASMLNASGEMGGAASKMIQSASTMDGVARTIDNASHRMGR